MLVDSVEENSLCDKNNILGQFLFARFKRYHLIRKRLRLNDNVKRMFYAYIFVECRHQVDWTDLNLIPKQVLSLVSVLLTVILDNSHVDVLFRQHAHCSSFDSVSTWQFVVIVTYFHFAAIKLNTAWIKFDFRIFLLCFYHKLTSQNDNWVDSLVQCATSSTAWAIHCRIFAIMWTFPSRNYYL